MSGHPVEQLDVVDDHNRVVGQASRQEIHERGLLHRSVHLLLVSPKRYFLLQQRAADRPTHPGRWDSSAAGHVAAGEDPDDAVRREARQEIGFELPALPAVLAVEGSPETENEWIRFYVREVEAPPQLAPDPSEVQAIRWWSEAELVDALVKSPQHFTPALTLLFFLWRQTGFVVPVRQPDGWYLIAEDETTRADVQRSFLESAGLRAQVSGGDRWVDPRAGRPLFFHRRAPRRPGLCVPPEEVAEAVALLFLSEPLHEP